ncbi:MAG TPA: hypothetical protein V6D50_15065 [Chroococcales cyanobacterium]
MHCLKRYFVIVPMMAAVSLLTVSCTESKISQCQKIIDVANQAVNETKSLTNNGQTSDTTAMLKAADAMEKASKDMNAIDIKDEKLKNYQTGYVSMYRDTSKATRDFVTAFKKKNRPAAETALTNLQRATASEPQLANGLNGYCKPQQSPAEKGK